MYKRVLFEISGGCNAMCRWCVSGKINRGGVKTSSRMIPVNEFKAAIEYLIDNNIINDKNLKVSLFNWGEPFLHPKFHDIIEVLNQKQIMFGLSTNASITRLPYDKDEFKNLKHIRFSMPGFSQESYDRIHGFDFEEIKENIVCMTEGFKKAGFHRTAKVEFLAYQFNLGELEDAKAFFESHNIQVNASCAYFNGSKMMASYLKSTMPYEDLKKASEELLLFYFEKTLKQRPVDYRCPQYDSLVIDEFCNVLTCCCLDKDVEGYSIGNLFDMNYEQIREKKQSSPACVECRTLGVDYLGHNPLIISS